MILCGTTYDPCCAWVLGLQLCQLGHKLMLVFFFRTVKTLFLENIIGFILNIPNDYKIGFLHLPVQRKHWVAIREVNSQYYNLDSKLDAPEVIGNVDDLRSYLSEQLESKDKELLLVVSPEIATTGTWHLDEHLKPASNLMNSPVETSEPNVESECNSDEPPKRKPKSADYAEVHIMQREKSKEAEAKMNANS